MYLCLVYPNYKTEIHATYVSYMVTKQITYVFLYLFVKHLTKNAYLSISLY
jgi:hypothetical protein